MEGFYHAGFFITMAAGNLLMCSEKAALGIKPK